jgi:methyl-accepting chemotaxis protein
LKDDYFVHHPIAERVGKPDDGGKLADGRSVVQAYREGLASSANNKAFLELPTTKPGDPTKTLYPKLNGVLKFEPWGWMPGIGFYIDDINARFWMQSSIFLAVGALLFVILSFLTFRMRGAILSQLGGEPQDAADNMRKIANGDLSVVVPVESGDNTSMMASLKLMQMKLTNLTSAIQENAVTLVDQVQKFDGVAKTYADSRSEEDFSALSRAVKKLGKTADILGKSISRFKM